jgi:ribosomal protein S12 methylthiotransferase
MKFYFISLGCAKNLVDSENLTKRLLKRGYAITGDIREASLVIINTCGFIKEAKQESIDTIFSVLQEKRANAGVVVYGCLVQRYQSKIRELIPEVTLFLPLLSYDELTEEIIKMFPPRRFLKKGKPAKAVFTLPSYTYVKIAEGCKNNCSYCTIPLIRGPLKSLPMDDVVYQVKAALDKGFFEINLIAQDLSLYGTDLYGGPELSRLLKNILAIRNDFWLRLLYLYPSRISPELIDTILSDPRIVRYIDMPIQHVSNRMLKLMNRDYTKDLLRKKIAQIRKAIPGVALRTTFIVGFPTEEEKDFQELKQFLKEIEFDHVGVFEYSPEEDTAAYSLRSRVPSHMKRKRKKILMEIQRDIVKNKNNKLIGKKFSCIVEQPIDNESTWQGRIYSQAPEVDSVVYIIGYKKTMGPVATIQITGFQDYDLTAECLG